MSYHNIDDEGFWQMGPDSLEYQRLMAELIDVQIARFPLGPAEDPETPFASVVHMPPGYELWRHKHDCYRFEAVIKGSLTTGDGRVLRPGDVMHTEPHELYGPYFVGDEGCVTVEIFSRRAGMPTIIDESTDPRAIEFLRGLMNDDDPKKQEAARISVQDSEIEL